MFLVALAATGTSALKVVGILVALKEMSPPTVDRILVVVKTVVDRNVNYHC